MHLYHGSEKIIRQPVYGAGKRNNDYGRGFYCTENIDLAREWACGNGNDGFVNCYSFDIESLNVLHLNEPPYNILNWLAILTQHRTYWQNGAVSEQAKDYLKEHFAVDLSPFDVIIGYRADDSYFSFAQDFVAGAISLQKLSEAMHLGRLGEQVMLKSPKAFKNIHFERYESVPAEIYYTKKRQRDLDARREYRRGKRETDRPDDLFMIDIMREGIENGDPRLQ